jgi:hypothetical protein
MPLAEDQHVIQALAAQCAHEPLQQHVTHESGGPARYIRREPGRGHRRQSRLRVPGEKGGGGFLQR